MPGKDPLSDVPYQTRYRNASADRYHDMEGKGDAGTYDWYPVTIGEEAMNGGYLTGSTPTGPMGSLRRNVIVGSRGEVGYDSDNISTGKGGLTGDPTPYSGDSGD